METPREQCETIRQELEKKANHNKKESLLSFKLIMAATILSPVLINISENPYISKWAPTLLTGTASFLTAWLTLRKPESLWGIYRTSQRAIEKQLRLYDNKIDDYEQDDRDKVLIKKVTGIFDLTHEEWLKLVPSQELIKKLSKPEKR